MMCVGNDDDVRAVALGETGALAGMKPGSILIDHTTASVTLARELAAAAGERGIEFLDAEAVTETISKGAASSWQMHNHYQTVLRDEYEFGFAVDWMRKDLGMAMEEAESIGAELPVARMVDGFYEEVQQMGDSRWDTTSLLTRYTCR